MRGFWIAADGGFEGGAGAGFRAAEHRFKRRVPVDEISVGTRDHLRFVDGVSRGLEDVAFTHARADTDMASRNSEKQEKAKHREYGDDREQQRLARPAGKQAEHDCAGSRNDKNC